MNPTYQVGSVVFQNWIITKRIGAGSFGEVFEIQREIFGSEHKAALKVISVPQSKDEYNAALTDGMSNETAQQYFRGMAEAVVREFEIMYQFKGTSNIVSYEDHEVIPHTDGCSWDIILRMELLTPLKSYIQYNSFTRHDVIRLGIDILKALELCQKNSVIHRDIKPENIFISPNGNFKLGDFGIARTVEKASLELSKKGTFNYMAPEVYSGKEYGFSVDTYSLGLVLYRLLNKNCAPFLSVDPTSITYAAQEAALTRRISGESIPPPVYADEELSRIVLKACAYSPEQRYSNPKEMREDLESISNCSDDTENICATLNEAALVHQGVIEESYSLSATIPQFGNRLHNGDVQKDDLSDHTQSIFAARPGEQSKRESIVICSQTDQTNTPQKRKTWPVVLLVMVLAVGCVAAIFYARQAKIDRYSALLSQGQELRTTDPSAAQEMFAQAQKLFPSQSAAYIEAAYTFLIEQQYETCITYIEDELALGKRFDQNAQSQLSEILATAYFESGDYAAAASFYRLSSAGGDITVPAMQNYAIALGRLGDIDAAQEVVQRMLQAGADSDYLVYVQAELDYAQANFPEAEMGYLQVLASAKDIGLQRHALRSLAVTYRDCTILAQSDMSPIISPALKAIDLLETGIPQYGLEYDSSLWEMLAMAYYNAYQIEEGMSEEYLSKAAECYQTVIDLGIQMDYLYSNLYTIYCELNDFDQAALALERFENVFPDDYIPHALRAIMLITLENEKPQQERDYSAAVAEYEIAGTLIKGTDDTVYYQQLESIVVQLKEKGWI